MSDEVLHIEGHYTCVCRDKDGRVKWVDEIHNTVVTVGKNLLLDTALAGAAYTVTGPFMGLISSASFSAIAAGDTMGSHAGWLEAGNAHPPTYSGARQVCVFGAAAAGSKSLSTSLTFTFTGSGTVHGAFIVYGSGAIATIDSPAGTLLSAGLLSGGDKLVAATDTLTMSWLLSL